MHQAYTIGPIGYWPRPDAPLLYLHKNKLHENSQMLINKYRVLRKN